MNGMLVPHRTNNPRWCDQCRHPSIGRVHESTMDMEADRRT